MTQDTAEKAIDRADKLADLLEHIGWGEVLKPQLEAYRSSMEKALVQVILGGRAIIEGGELSKEQIAARADAISFLIGRIETILKSGAQALKMFETEIHYT
jgi:hypothetical protein